MQFIPTSLPEVILIQPKLCADDRGVFYESYNKRVLASVGIDYEFVQDNQSISRQGVLRGLHYQIQQPQAKLVRVIKGSIFDVAIDLRRHSLHFGRCVGVTLKAEDKQSLFIPPWFAHGFLVLSDFAEVHYKTSDYYAPPHERCIRWDDPQLAIQWPLVDKPVLSDKDRAGIWFNNAEVFA
ncbi:MAG: dTDP-4-dehydrorhamnose 3,5-epimerase [Gammaproteobacteria bacterium]|nr:dTDP-4-dehydrorhamnose 3,5-epimerase [Gammaproteobacteria bacterium]